MGSSRALLVATLIPVLLGGLSAVFDAAAPEPAAAQDGAPPELALVNAFPGVGFSRPILVTHAPGDPDRLFVVEQRGRIKVVQLPVPAAPLTADVSTFMNLADRVSQSGNERGLLGLAFHPGYQQNGRFFAHYTRHSDGATILSEFSRGGSEDAGSAGSEQVLLSLSQPYSNHNGGMIAFGPDGMLYVGLGDGGSAGDPVEAGQDLSTWLGAVLRIDVDGKDAGLQYRVPADNPFTQRAGARPEIWAYGLRNPWRFSFDRETGELWLGDVGQNRREEIDVIAKGGNYGWDRKEGNADFEPEANPPADPLLAPIHTYGHSEGESVTGGVVYRGPSIPALDGVYLFADYSSGNLWGLWRDQQQQVVTSRLLPTGEAITSFGEDHAGEVYVCSFSNGGRVLRLVGPQDEPPPEDLPERLSETPLFADLAGHVPVAAALRYGVRSPLWSDGAAKDRFILLPPGAAMEYDPEEAFDVPVGTWLVKTFRVKLGGGRTRRLETRVILRTEDGFAMAAYRWDEALTDAVRVDEHAEEALGGTKGPASWAYPSREECRSCHTEAAGLLLGLRSRQIRHVRHGRADLLRRWQRRGALAGDLGPKSKRPKNLPVDGRGKLERRVRSYLDANCSFCHRPGAPEPAGLDLRAEAPLAATGLVDALPQRGDLGLEDARVIAPGAPERSVLIERMRLRDGDRQMPNLGTAEPHARALRSFERWVRRLR